MSPAPLRPRDRLNAVTPRTFQLVLGSGFEPGETPTSSLSATNLDDWRPVRDLMRSSEACLQEVQGDNINSDFDFASELRITFSNSTDNVDPSQALPEHILGRHTFMEAEVPLTMRTSHDGNLLLVKLYVTYNCEEGDWEYESSRWELISGSCPNLDQEMAAVEKHFQNLYMDELAGYHNIEHIYEDVDTECDRTARWIHEFRAGLDEHLNKLVPTDGDDGAPPREWNVGGTDWSMAAHQEYDEEQARHAQLNGNFNSPLAKRLPPKSQEPGPHGQVFRR